MRIVKFEIWVSLRSLVVCQFIILATFMVVPYYYGPVKRIEEIYLLFATTYLTYHNHLTRKNTTIRNLYIASHISELHLSPHLSFATHCVNRHHSCRSRRFPLQIYKIQKQCVCFTNHAQKIGPGLIIAAIIVFVTCWIE